MMKISWTKFWLIFLAILLLPFSKNWRLLLFGESVTGEVIDQQYIINEYTANRYSYDKVSVIEFTARGYVVKFMGPVNLIYPIGKKIKIRYNPEDPTDCIPLNLGTIYMGNQMIIPGLLLLIWTAFYMTVNQTQFLRKKQKDEHKKSTSYPQRNFHG